MCQATAPAFVRVCRLEFIGDEAMQREKDIREHNADIFYSKRYSDDLYEYRYCLEV